MIMPAIAFRIPSLIACLSLTLALVLQGCGGNAFHGNHLGESSAVDQNQLASEAANQLTALYPPARVKLELQQVAQDPFGQSLVKRLREKGFAIVEFDTKGSGKAESPTETAAPAQGLVKEPPKPIITSVDPQAMRTLSLRYVLDQAGTENLYRMNLLVGSQSISRPYRIQNGRMVAAGAWIRKE
jgi:hypothetical protein